MINARVELDIDRLGHRGEGVARGPAGPVFVPYALPGERIVAEVDGERGSLAEILAPSPDRVEPFCRRYGVCGGCAVQALAAPAYQSWKRGLLVEALDNAGVKADVAPLVDAHGAGRRRASFHAGFSRDARGMLSMRVGFMRARAHDIVDIEACPVLAPDMAASPSVARAFARTLSPLMKPLDIVVTASRDGFDVDIRGTGALNAEQTAAVCAQAERLDIARVSIHGATVLERRAPVLAMGRAMAAFPPGAFLQATLAGEEALAGLATAAVKGARRVADLFSGVGTFALRLAEHAEVHAVEADLAAGRALERAAHSATGLRGVSVERRDLFRRPLTAAELDKYEAVVFDPPRAGAIEQARALSASRVPTVVAVSCNVQTFARDAKILVDGGYALERATPVDQFRHSPHVETVGVFRRPKASTSRRRSLLG
jgi:23S rRNA (uracil1939-C5)-methyltransferase